MGGQKQHIHCAFFHAFCQNIITAFKINTYNLYTWWFHDNWRKINTKSKWI